MEDVLWIVEVPPDASLPVCVHTPRQYFQGRIYFRFFRNNQIIDLFRPSQGTAEAARHAPLTRRLITAVLRRKLHDVRVVFGAAGEELAWIVDSGLPGGHLCRMSMNRFCHMEYRLVVVLPPPSSSYISNIFLHRLFFSSRRPWHVLFFLCFFSKDQLQHRREIASCAKDEFVEKKRPRIN